MNKIGFRLNCLRAVSNKDDHAEIMFQPSLNVIAGISNTGKSYIRQCLDFMFGADTLPDDIEEGRTYETLFLEIQDRQNKIYTLERSLKGGDFHLYQQSLSEIKFNSTPRILKSKADSTTENISSFLLSLCGVTSARLRKNQKNETVNLTFRTIIQLFLIDETSIIEKKSPIYSKSGFANTSAKSAFNFLLTSIDDSSLIAIPDKTIRQAQYNAKMEVYNQLIAELEKKIKSQNQSTDSLNHQIENIKITIAILSSSIKSSSVTILEQQQIREIAWNTKQEADSRLIVISELLKRFDLLKQHYNSDLQRLEFINEGEHYFSQLQTVRCPLCGIAVEAHILRKMCTDKSDSFISISTACFKEAAKIRTLLRDLEYTMVSLKEEKIAATKTSEEKQQLIDLCDSQIAEILKPKQLTEKNELDHLLSDRQALSELEMNMQRLQELKAAQTALVLSNVETKAPKITKGLDTVALRNLCDLIEGILKEWKYPDLGTVEFNEQRMDILIGGKPRQNNGKGIRALLHAAFAIGLMRYCKTNNLPHPGWVLLDSPLTTLREGQKRATDIAGEIQAAFFENLALSPNDEQIIILENKEPDREIQLKINYINFVGREGKGRIGFFPIK